MEQARTTARDGEFNGSEIERLFRDGSEGERIYALAVLQERPELASAQLIFDAVRAGRSRFEQYHALLLAELVAPRLLPEEKLTLRRTLSEQVKSGNMPLGGDRGRLATRVLANLE